MSRSDGRSPGPLRSRSPTAPPPWCSTTSPFRPSFRYHFIFSTVSMGVVMIMPVAVRWKRSGSHSFTQLVVGAPYSLFPGSARWMNFVAEALHVVLPTIGWSADRMPFSARRRVRMRPVLLLCLLLLMLTTHRARSKTEAAPFPSQKVDTTTSTPPPPHPPSPPPPQLVRRSYRTNPAIAHPGVCSARDRNNRMKHGALRTLSLTPSTISTFYGIVSFLQQAISRSSSRQWERKGSRSTCAPSASGPRTGWLAKEGRPAGRRPSSMRPWTSSRWGVLDVFYFRSLVQCCHKLWYSLIVPTFC